MERLPTSRPPGDASSDRRLNSWKEIAGYLECTTRTAQHWERVEGLPIHRHSHTKRDSVYAFRSELDAWLARRHGYPLHRGSTRHATAGNRRLLLAGGLAAAALSAIATGLLITRSEVNPAPLPAIPLTTYPGEEIHPAISPDGHAVAFAWNGEKQDNFDIYVRPIDLDAPLRLTTHPARDRSPAWSPDGRYIAFLRRGPEGSGKSIVFIIPASGGAEHMVGEVRARGGRRQLSWSPDGKWLAAIDKESRDKPAAVFLLSIETGAKRRLTRPPADSIGDTGPEFAPDGRTLAFTRSAGSELSDLFLLSLSGGYHATGEPRRLTFSGRAVSTAAWLPNGKEVVYAHPGTTLGLWRIAATGRNEPAPLAGFGEDAVNVAVARQGNRLVYARQNVEAGIWRIETDRAGNERSRSHLIRSTRRDCNAQYSPAGDRIAFSSDRSGNLEIWTSRSDGSACTRMTSFAGPHTGSPRWSPDGGSIAFSSRPEGNTQVYVVDSRGGVPRKVSHPGRFEEGVPSWSRDGKWIYFSSNRAGIFELWKMPADGKGEPVQLTRGGALSGCESYDGKWVYFHKASIWKMPAGGGAASEVVGPVHSPHAYAVTKGGIYYVPPNDGDSFSIRFFDFERSENRLVASVDKPWYPGLAASDDNRSILYSAVDRRASELMLVENFR